MKNIIYTLARLTFLMIIPVFILGGCMHTSPDAAIDDGHEKAAAEKGPQFEPYYPADFRDLLIPGELLWNREKSVTISTDSFNGGILSFNGRVEVTSLMEFFINSMKNDGWTTVGSIKSKNVLLSFTKDNSTCMIRILEGGPIGKTDVAIFITRTIQ
jgi:hypothetical protein